MGIDIYRYKLKGYEFATPRVNGVGLIDKILSAVEMLQAAFPVTGKVFEECHGFDEQDIEYQSVLADLAMIPAVDGLDAHCTNPMSDGNWGGIGWRKPYKPTKAHMLALKNFVKKYASDNDYGRIEDNLLLVEG